MYQPLKNLLRLILFLSAALCLVMLSAVMTNSRPVHAIAPTSLPTPSGPDRYTTMQVDITLYEWWLAAWSDNSIRCSFSVDHDGLPKDADILSACGDVTYGKWKAYSVPCAQQDVTTCPGYYLIQISSKAAKRNMTVKLPAPQVKVTMEDCAPDASGWCTQQPTLILTADEPLPNESITSINGIVGNDPFSCNGNRCVFRLAGTAPEGIRLNFWANSTHGDSSKQFEALLRVISDGGGERLTSRYFVNIISSQWEGAPVASCASAWESFLPPEGPPQWLSTPASSDLLKTNIPYNYLAANLITQGVADVSACPYGGLNLDGSANACGMKAAEPAVQEWQNRFDKLIFNVAQDTKVPAQLLKNLFSRESQFWPGVFRNGKDVGLGQLTEGGADTALLWNPSFYTQFCPLVLDKDLCTSTGFANLNPAHQELLRGALVSSVDARCADCPLGLDLSRADFSVGVFARTMLANCEQAGKIVKDVTGRMPGQVLDYDTLWRFTLVNYNAGSGCLATAINQAYVPSAQVPLTWDNVASVLDGDCPGSVGYVNDVSKILEPDAQPTEQPPATEAPPNPVSGQ
jgi:hypothetical protein